MPRLSKIGAAALAAFGWTGGQTVSASYLVVAGGGGGGTSIGGGGGAGGLLTGTTSLNPTLSYTITIGAGGAGSTSFTLAGTSGSNSEFNAISSTGGGGGGSEPNSNTGAQNGLTGGSGGGGGSTVTGVNGTGGTATSGQGNAGAAGSTDNTTYRVGGGGGGAGSAGSTGTASTNGAGGAGGSGTASSISGSSVTYAGGGGGSPHGSGTAGAGGSGGGGNSGTSSSATGVAGTANLGGGGGAGGNEQVGAGGKGGSGVVIISYVGAQQFGGGTVSSSGGSTIHTFTTSGTLSPLSSLTASYLIVAGGGAGGGSNGGGGAGGLLSGSSLTIDTNSIYAVTVGAGGTAAGSSAGGNGGNSSFSMVSTTAVGGGGGGYQNNPVNGANGGSGGGGAYNGPGAGGTGTAGQGNNGGSGAFAASQYGGGGGGGAGAVGANGTGSGGGNGGAGTSNSISGSAVTYAGGGGGGSNTSSAGTGGAGGGGAGGINSGVGTAGTANTGGGGGGGANSGAANTSGGAGGSGVVIISYSGSTQQMAGGTVTVAGGNVIHTFTSSGYLTPIVLVTNSLRFRSSASAYLQRTPTSAATSRRIMTYSVWAKIGTLGTQRLLYEGFTSVSDLEYFYFNSSDQLEWGAQVNGGSSYGVRTPAVFRDPSAWYHIVCAIDTTQATSTNRVRIYVNGVEQTGLTTFYSGFPAQNEDLEWNNQSSTQVIAWGGHTGYYDGYMAEISMVDGQALTPFSFGTTSDLGVWQPIRYGGSYGTNGFYLKFQQPSTSTYYASFNGSSQSLNAPSSANLALNADLTIEAWAYPTTSSGTRSLVVSRGSYTNSTGYAFGINGTNNLFIYTASGFAGTSSTALASNAWSHVAWVRSGSTNTFYINGIASGTFTNSNNYSDPSTNSTFIGTNDLSAEYFTGNISNVRIVKGTAVYTSGFIPQTTPLTAITNTQLLTLQNATIIDNSTNAFTITNTGSVVTTANTGVFLNTTVLASDQSSSGNNWTPNNISLTAGSTYDSMTDVPTLTSATTANYCTLNPLFNPNGSIVTYSNGNLNFSHSSGTANQMPVQGTIALPAGKFYWEYTVGATVNDQVGIATAVVYGGSADGTAGARYLNGGTFQSSYTTPSSAASYTTGDVIGVAYDQPNGTLAFYKNNSLQGTVTAISTSEVFFPSRSPNSSGSGGAGSFNFGQQPLVYTAPSGFVALNTFNLPTPTIGATAATTANEYFDATVYTGTNANLSIVNSGSMQPDFVWIKNRGPSARAHNLVDSVRGSHQVLFSNDTAAEATSTITTGVLSFASNGFNLGLDTSTAGSTNASGESHVGWQWRASNATAVTNTSGSITSSVSASTTAGFSIVTYTGNATSGATVGHGLGVAPSMYIVKTRSTTESWITYHISIGATNYLALNLTQASSAATAAWNNTAPTSTVFSLGNAGSTNGSGNTFVAYCFAQVAGYSAFGTYTGNGSTDGPFIFTGFRPRYVMIKRSNTTGDWIVYDSARSTYNGITSEIYPNLSNAEDNSSVDLDFVSNGIKLRNSGSGVNASGDTYIYACFSENPFKYANAR